MVKVSQRKRSVHEILSFYVKCTQMKNYFMLTEVSFENFTLLPTAQKYFGCHWKSNRTNTMVCIGLHQSALFAVNKAVSCFAIYK